MDSTLLRDLVVLGAVAFFITALSDRFRFPPLVGLLIAGVLLGPAGFSIVESSASIRLLAELGITLLLFTLGLEFSLHALWQTRKLSLLGGTLQIGATVLFASLLWLFWQRAPIPEALGVGLIVALSSTAVGLRLLLEHGDFEAPHGRAAFSVLLFQDAAVAPIFLLLQLLGELQQEGIWKLLRSFALLLSAAVVLFISLRLLIGLLAQVLRLSVSREALLFMGLTIGIGAALLSYVLGLSAALGAFIAGLLLSGLRERYRLMATVEPFRDAFSSLFFLSVGLLLTPAFFQEVSTICIVAGILFGGKLLIVFGLLRAFRYPARTALLTGLLLASVGEFAIVGFSLGASHGLFRPDLLQFGSGVVALTMLSSTVLYTILRKHRLALPSAALPEGRTEGHVLIIGYGITGQTVHAAVKAAGLPYTIMELNPFTVARLEEAGEPVIHGDCTDEKSLRRAGADRAAIIVVAISDTLLLPKAVGILRLLNPSAFLAVRTRFIAHIEPLYAAGASVVVAEEFEATLHLLALLLRHLGVPEERIRALQEHFRAQHYELFQKQLLDTAP
jgi:CPA2 family monovalent cation:H+ antiporter-2